VSDASAADFLGDHHLFDPGDGTIGKECLVGEGQQVADDVCHWGVRDDQ
jgi:hypothetical protein